MRIHEVLNERRNGTRLVVFGSRHITDRERVYAAIWWALGAWDLTLERLVEVVSGGAEGVDTLAIQWAKDYDVSRDIVRPEYSRYPVRLAPKYRNWEMAKRADRGIGVWEGFSGGTGHMATCLIALGKPVLVRCEAIP